MIEQRDALFRLLADDDQPTLDLVKGQLSIGGVAALPALRALLAGADARSAPHLREVIAGIEEREADAVFAQLCAGFREHDDVEDAAWRLAATFYPGEDFLSQRESLDVWGAEVVRRFRKAHSALDRVETLAEFLSDETRLDGNEEDYYDVENSLLPTVIDSRRGIPITLSLVYILVGRRAGLELDGVGLPGHFLVRHRDIFFDPFHGGRRVGLDECRSLLEQQDLTLLPQHLAPATPRQMLSRMLTNIYFVAEQNDSALAVKVAGWIRSLGA